MSIHSSKLRREKKIDNEQKIVVFIETKNLPSIEIQ